MGDAIEIAVKICILFLLVGVGCLLIVAAWGMLFDWWYERDADE